MAHALYSGAHNKTIALWKCTHFCYLPFKTLTLKAYQHPVATDLIVYSRTCPRKWKALGSFHFFRQTPRTCETPWAMDLLLLFQGWSSLWLLTASVAPARRNHPNICRMSHLNESVHASVEESKTSMSIKPLHQTGDLLIQYWVLNLLWNAGSVLDLIFRSHLGMVSSV